MELLGVLFLLILSIIILKLFIWFLKAGFFIITLPIKIIFAVIAAIVALILLPAIILPVMVAVVIPLIPFLLIGLGIILLIKYAT